MRPKIYVAHVYGCSDKLSQDARGENVKDCLENFARPLILLGYNPFVPLLYHYIHIGWYDSPNEQEYFHMVSDWIKDCSKFLMAKNAENSGVNREIETAKNFGVHIYYRLSDVPDLR